MRRLENFTPAKKPFAVWLTALATAACVVLIPLFSAVYVFAHANHAHDHNGPEGSCAACVRAASFAKFQFASAVAPEAARAFFAQDFAGARVLKPLGIRADFTLVSLKIRLNN
jgi:hypothetical protein